MADASGQRPGQVIGLNGDVKPIGLFDDFLDARATGLLRCQVAQDDIPGPKIAGRDAFQDKGLATGAFSSSGASTCSA